mmetsp:Transcript_25836/g.72986  ORF Transcript_25836/g.72986 Transcript_25836/m.72986 type:complete len:213 (+) Transcript_25836:470-1108(+)
MSARSPNSGHWNFRRRSGRSPLHSRTALQSAASLSPIAPLSFSSSLLSALSSLQRPYPASSSAKAYCSRPRRRRKAKVVTQLTARSSGERSPLPCRSLAQVSTAPTGSVAKRWKCMSSCHMETSVLPLLSSCSWNWWAISSRFIGLAFSSEAWRSRLMRMGPLSSGGSLWLRNSCGLAGTRGSTRGSSTASLVCAWKVAMKRSLRTERSARA